MLDSHATVDNKNSFKEVITDKIKIAIFKNIILYVKHLQIAEFVNCLNYYQDRLTIIP